MPSPPESTKSPKQEPSSPAVASDPNQDAANGPRSDDAPASVKEEIKEEEHETKSVDQTSDDEEPEKEKEDENEPAGPPLPDEPAPQPEQPEDDGWDCQFDPSTQAWFFYNRFTGKTQWENPRVPNATDASAGAAAAPGANAPQPPVSEKPAAGGYNPAIHGDYDPNAWYAKGQDETEQEAEALVGADATGPYSVTASFNRFTGGFQTADMGPGRHSDEAKSKRQMNSYFDVDAAANAHDGRSLKAERSNKKPSKQELKAFKEKRRAKKEEKRRAWLMN